MADGRAHDDAYGAICNSGWAMAGSSVKRDATQNLVRRTQ